MGLLHEIQNDAVKSSVSISDLLLKTQLLAAKAKSDSLAEWVKYESEGYPNGVTIPSYRILSVTYVGTFSGPFGSMLKNAPLPSMLISEIIGDDWNTFSVGSSISEIEALANSGQPHLSTGNAANLIPLLHGVFEGYGCAEVTGRLSTPSLVAIQHTVRSKILSLTLELEEEFPESANISTLKPLLGFSKEITEGVERMTKKIVYGNNTEFHTSGDRNKIAVNVSTGNIGDISEAFKTAGVPDKDANEIAKIISNEQPARDGEPLGANAQKWLAKSISKAADGTWNIGTSTLAGLLTAVAAKFYGIG